MIEGEMDLGEETEMKEEEKEIGIKAEEIAFKKEDQEMEEIEAQ